MQKGARPLAVVAACIREDSGWPWPRSPASPVKANGLSIPSPLFSSLSVGEIRANASPSVVVVGNGEEDDGLSSGHRVALELNDQCEPRAREREKRG